MPRRGSHRLRRAFTLVELLVVIAIIAILAGILFPVFAQAREKARQASCQFNLKQIGTAIAMYLQDHDGMYPDSRLAYDGLDGGGCSAIGQNAPTDPGAASTSCWEARLYAPGTAGATTKVLAGYPARLNPYVKTDRIFRCPSDQQSDPGGTPRRGVPGPERTSYFFRRAHDRFAVQRGGVRESSISRGTELAMVMEEAWHGGLADPYFWTSNDRGTKRTNALFYDGHVHILPVDFITGTNNLSNYDVDGWFNGPGVSANGDWDLGTNPSDLR